MIQQIGRYEILERVGRGGMGTVYKARDPRLGRLVALKVISGDGDVTDELKTRFYREAQACATLNHPNVVTVYDLGEDDGRLFIVMEFLEGEELKHVIAQRKRFFLEEKLDLMIQVCDGLHYAHQKGIIHRDVKPGNIFVLRTGQAKILDFGLARIATSDPGLTRTGLIMGTLRYMSPEQARGRVDHRSDIFSVGAVFYELLSYRPAFASEDPMEILELLRTTDPPPLTDVEPGVPRELAAIVERALRKDPAQRFPDLGQMRAQLEGIRRRLGDEAERLQARVRAQLEDIRAIQDKLAARLGEAPEDETLPVVDDRGRVATLQALERELAAKLERLRARAQRVDAVEPAWARGVELLRGGKLEAAVAEFERVLQAIPEHRGALEGLTQARRAMPVAAPSPPPAAPPPAAPARERPPAERAPAAAAPPAAPPREAAAPPRPVPPAPGPPAAPAGLAAARGRGVGWRELAIAAAVVLVLGGVAAYLLRPASPPPAVSEAPPPPPPAAPTAPPAPTPAPSSAPAAPTPLARAGPAPERVAAEAARTRMLAAREEAAKADAERLVLKFWAAAVAKHREADTALDKGEAESAEAGYRDAQQRYEWAGREARQAAVAAQEAQKAAEAERQKAAEAERQRVAEAARVAAAARQEMERARSGAVSSREQAHRSEADKFAKNLFDGARTREQEADGLASRQSFAAATQAYGDAALGYGAAAQRAQLIRAARSEADQARAQMLDTKKRANSNAPNFQAGAAEEQQGHLAYERLAFKQAADHFRAAQAAFAKAPGGSAEPRAPSGDARTEIQAVLDAYKRAIEAKDLALLQKVRPALRGAELRRLRDSLEQVKSQTVDLSVQSVEVHGDEAEAKVHRVDVVVPNEGREIRTEGTFVFRFKRAAGSWVIDAVN